MKKQNASKKNEFWFTLAHFHQKHIFYKHSKFLIVWVLNYMDTVPNVPYFYIFLNFITKAVKNWEI